MYMEVRNLKLRKESLDRAERRCEKCGTFKGLRVYYKIAPAKGGEDTLDNAAVLCPHCYREYLFLMEDSISCDAWHRLPPAPVVVQALLDVPEETTVAELREILERIAEEARQNPGFWWGKHHHENHLF
jgi:hypothetical protein